MQEIKGLTQYAHGAGCGCKIAPEVLQEILHSETPEFKDSNLLVGNKSNDDAAVYDMGNGSALISTADFFMPIVDDPYDFGRVAAANAISDVYAMGGRPLMAIALLGWPVTKLPTLMARKVIEGARAVCAEAAIPLAGGHSIDTLEPMFGLSVNGIVATSGIKRNNTAREGDLLFITKSIGTGIMSTAMKRGQITESDMPPLISQLVKLNKVGEQLGKIKGVNAMTDVTGFGLMGHLLEMANGSGLTAVLNYGSIPLMNNLAHYLKQNIVPDATYRNWNAYQGEVFFGDNVNVAEAFTVLPDPQTNGGILLSVEKESVEEVLLVLKTSGLDEFSQPIGRMENRGEKALKVLE